MTNTYSYNTMFAGIYRAIIVKKLSAKQVRIYIPSLQQNINANPISPGGGINQAIYSKYEKSYPLTKFCTFFEDYLIWNEGDMCWISFENGDVRYPIIVNWFENTLVSGSSSSGSSSGSSTSNQSGGSNNINNNPSLELPFENTSDNEVSLINTSLPNGLQIDQSLPSKSENYGSSRNVNDIKFIVIHYTGNKTDTAKNNAKYFNISLPLVSAHYFVDSENIIYQSVADNYIAWHCGTKGTYKHPSCRNNNSLGIELCCNNYGFKDETVNNAIELTKYLMTKYNISSTANIVRHYDVTGKNCPAPFVKDINAWQNFKNRL